MGEGLEKQFGSLVRADQPERNNVAGSGVRFRVSSEPVGVVAVWNEYAIASGRHCGRLVENDPGSGAPIAPSQKPGLRSAAGFVCLNVVCRTDDRSSGELQAHHQHHESDSGGNPCKSAVAANHYFGPVDMNHIVMAEECSAPTEVLNTHAGIAYRVGKLHHIWVRCPEWPAGGQQDSQRVFVELTGVADSRSHASVS